jgi:hypothetical protein
MSTAELVDVWRRLRETAQPGDLHTASIIRAIELELHHRPVRERIAAGYDR